MRSSLIMVSAILVFCLAPVSGQENENTAGEVDRSRPAPEIRLAGADEIPVSRLRQVASRELASFDNQRGRPADLADAAYVMESYIREQGFPDSTVTFRMIHIQPGGGQQLIRSASLWDLVDLVEFVVREGPKAVLGTVDFPGASAIEEDRLREFVPQGGMFNRAPVYRRRDIQEAVSKIERLYSLEGYANAEIGPLNVNPRTEADRLVYDITVPVREGEKYRIREIEIKAGGIEEPVIREIRNSIRLIGEPYFPRQTVIGANIIRNELGKRGYQAEVEHSADLRENGSVILQYQVNPGNRLVLNRVVIRNEGEGTLRTRKGFIRSLFSVEPGEILDLQQLEQTESEFYGLGLFTYVEMEVEPIGEPQEPRPANVIMTFAESKSRYIEISGGWGSYELLRGALTYSDRNLFGAGRLWSTSVHGSFRSYGANTVLTDRILFGPSSTITLSGGYNFRAKPAFERTTAEAGLSFSYRFSPRWSARTSYQYTYSRVRETAAEAEGGDLEVLSTGRIGLGGEYDTRDSPLLPTTGTSFASSGFIATRLLGSEIDFAGVQGDISTYHPLLSDLVLSFYSRYSTRIILDDRETLPIQERLFLGGEFSVRSFRQDELGPTTAGGSPAGGLTSLQASTELRIGVVGNLHAALFYDIGMVSSETWMVFGDYGQAIGAGLRYYLPVGPIRLDFAWNPGPLYAAESPWALHFAIGFSF